MSDRPKKLFESTHVGLFDIDNDDQTTELRYNKCP